MGMDGEKKRRRKKTKIERYNSTQEASRNKEGIE